MQHPGEADLSPVNITLEFSLGYWCLYAHPVLARRNTKHFTELPAHPISADDASDLFRTDQRPVSILSHPIRHSLSTVEIGPTTLRYVPARYPRYFVQLSGSFDHYLQGLSRKRRGELLRKMRKFGYPGSSCFQEYRSPDEICKFFDLAIEISRRSFKQHLGYGLPQDSNWLAQLIRLAERDEVRGYILFYAGRPAAFSLCRVQGAWLTGELCGYDTEFSQLSPGNVLISFLLKRLFSEKSFRMLDFGTGDALYKSLFATGNFACADIYYFSRTWKNLGFVLAHWVTVAFWNWITRLLDLFGVRNRLKKLARNGWRRPQVVRLEELVG